MNWFGITYYAGIGMNLFNVFGIEFQFEAVGAGTQINLGPLNIGVNVNLIGGTSLTIGWNTDLGDGLTRTEGITIGINTGFLLATILWIFKFLQPEIQVWCQEHNLILKEVNFMKIKMASATLFWCTLISLPVSFSVSAILGETEIFSVLGIIRYSWVMLLFIPIGICSFIWGLYLKRKN